MDVKHHVYLIGIKKKSQALIRTCRKLVGLPAWACTQNKRSDVTWECLMAYGGVDFELRPGCGLSQFRDTL